MLQPSALMSTSRSNKCAIISLGNVTLGSLSASYLDFQNKLPYQGLTVIITVTV